jgi:intraflagellar transport protein 172
LLFLQFLENKKAGNLLQHSRYGAAAQLYLGADMIREAIDALIAGEEWAKAKKVAKELDPRYEQYVDSKYKDFLKSAGNTEQLASVDLISALDMYAERGDWRKCIDTAAQNGQQVLQKYLALYAAHLVRVSYIRHVQLAYLYHRL